MPQSKVFKPTDYARGTIMEPEHISTLKASFGEYESLGSEHRKVSQQIEDLNEKMKLSRQRGAFQTLQNQMREIKDLVKKREDLDAKMAVADLARKKDDDRRLAMQQDTSYSEKLESVGDRIAQLESMMLSFAEYSEETLDFAMCQRPDGSRYGTRGNCEAPNRPVSASSAAKQTLPPGNPKRKLTPEELKAYKAGGGGAKVEKSGISTNEVINQGKKNLAKVGAAMSTRDRSAYAAGGGNAAGMRGKSTEEVIAQGKKNLERMDQGRGRSSNPQTQKQGFPKTKLSAEELKAYKAGGGGAKVEKSGISTNEVIAQGKKNLKKLEGGRAGAPLSEEERAAYKAGGGNAAAQKAIGGLDEVMDQGRKNLKRLDQGQGRSGRNFSEEDSDSLDFARCQRPDGSFYGTRGKCKKGKDAGAEQAAQPPAKTAKTTSKKGPLHKEVSEAKNKLKEYLPELKARKTEFDNTLKAARAQEKIVKKDKSKENRDKLKSILQTLVAQERAVRRTEKEVEKLARQWGSLNKKNQRAMMSPAQRAAEVALDKEIKLRG